jgi:tRNA-dihydrouridine synthase
VSEPAVTGNAGEALLRETTGPGSTGIPAGYSVQMCSSGRDTGSAPSSWDEALFARSEPALALAPMQDITDQAFWRLIRRYGGPDVYFTEYFRVHGTSVPERWIVESITANPTGRPVIAQLIGNDIPALVRTARALQRLPIAGIDFNLGCPAPVVYRKCAGGGLLRDLPRVDAILHALREAVTVKLSVKTRVGFESADGFDALLDLLAGHRLDWVTVHGRTVAGMYRSPVRYDLIARAAARLSCPVFANGNVHSADHALRVVAETSARGLMIGRGAIRNPWLFAQIQARLRGEPPALPAGRDVLAYLHALWEATARPHLTERSHVQRIKKYLNFVALGVEPSGRFLDGCRRATTRAGLFALWAEHLDHSHPLPLEPFAVPLGDRDMLAGVHC